MAADTDQTKSYRAYLIDKAGHVIKPLEIMATNDLEAVEQAKQYVDGHAVELWEKARKVIFLPTRE